MTIIKPTPQISDVDWQMGEHVDGLFIRKDQEITSEYLDALAEERLYSKAPAKDWHKFASIPVAVVEHWMSQGFNVYKEHPKDIIKRLQREDLTKFICTTKEL